MTKDARLEWTGFGLCPRAILVAGLLAVLAACGLQSENCASLEEHVDTLTIRVGLYPFGNSREGDPGGGLRAVILHRGNILLEPHAHWGGGGGPISSDAKLSREDMLALVEGLDRLAVWENAERYYSTARKEPRFDPPAGSPYVPQTKAFPHCKIRADYASEDYHSIFVAWIPWGDRTEEVLGLMRTHIPPPIAKSLLDTCRRFERRT
jgi:hypothetical protein